MKISRRTTLGLLTATLAKPVWAAPLSYEFKPVQIAHGLWMIEGQREYFDKANGGDIVNIVMMETDEGLVIVDTGSSLRYGERLVKLARELYPKGIAAVINTHHHPDHFFGNQVFADLPIYALPQTIEAAKTHGDAYSDNLYRLLGDWMRGTEVVPPNQILDMNKTVIGGRALEFIPLSGHTEADLAILDVETGTLISGDLVFYERAPTTPDADIPTWLTSLDFLESLEASAVIPGHGPLDQTGAALTQTRAYLNWMNESLKNAANQGFDMAEAMQIKLPEEFAKLGAEPGEYVRSVAHLYPDIEKLSLPLRKGGN